MNKSSVSLLALVAALSCATTFAATPAQEAAQAKITKEQATQAALGQIPKGVVKSAELEREHGKLVWSFDVAQSGKSGVAEVQVDATTGKVVSVKHESAKQEAIEASAEAKLK